MSASEPRAQRWWASTSAWQRFGLALGPLLATATWLLAEDLRAVPGFDDRPARAAAVGVLMAVWWFTEALPIAWTAAVPLVAFPLLGVFGEPLPESLGRTGVQ